MREVRIHELTGPKALRVDQLPSPNPGEGEVRIDVKAAGVNFPDVLLSYGKYQFKPTPPFVLGGVILLERQLVEDVRQDVPDEEIHRGSNEKERRVQIELLMLQRFVLGHDVRMGPDI